VPSDADRTGNLIDQIGTPDQPGFGGAVTGAGWANQLSQTLGYTVTQGEPYYSFGCTPSSPIGTCVFPNAVIPQSAWSPVAANTLKYVPSANGAVNDGPGFSTSAFNENLTDDKGVAGWTFLRDSALCSVITSLIDTIL